MEAGITKAKDQGKTQKKEKSGRGNLIKYLKVERDRHINMIQLIHNK